MGAGQSSLKRRRSIHLALPGADCSERQLAAYLALVDRPLIALLARERLQRAGRGRFIYRSNPLRLSQLELRPSLELAVAWCEPALQIRSTSCSIEGLGTWGERLGIALAAELAPAAAGLRGWAEVAVSSHLLEWPWAQQLTSPALELVLGRMERRLRRGLRQDLAAWLAYNDGDHGHGV
ncbi:MAG: DUF1997 domain-containing protein [Cyanobacteriota bacterium]